MRHYRVLYPYISLKTDRKESEGTTECGVTQTRRRDMPFYSFLSFPYTPLFPASARLRASALCPRHEGCATTSTPKASLCSLFALSSIPAECRSVRTPYCKLAAVYSGMNKKHFAALLLYSL
mmetsp:Transcript_7735/g.20108  ORF Transcript_7735/g.20108 Transcript_7735/m.20108 type:complete len:122 (+) Transcript_7735:3787-4152(+)